MYFVILVYLQMNKTNRYYIITMMCGIMGKFIHDPSVAHIILMVRIYWSKCYFLIG